MNVTFIVGNGFDLSLGMKTSYRDFYEYYCALPSRTPNIAKFKESIKRDTENGGENWSDFELGLGKYTEQFTLENASEFLECHVDAQEEIANYIKMIDEHYNNFEYEQQTVREFRENLLDYYQELNPKERQPFQALIDADRDYNMVFNFMSLNYTTALDKHIELLAKEVISAWSAPHGGQRTASVKPSVYHIHGKLDHFPIIGVRNESQIVNPGLLKEPLFSETIIKQKSIDAIGELWYDDAKKYIDNSSVICIYGTSLGETDGYLWNIVVQWLSANISRHVIVFWHTNNSLNNISIYKKLQQVTSVQDRLLSHANISDDKKREVRSQIHVVINTEKVLRFPRKVLVNA